MDSKCQKFFSYAKIHKFSKIYIYIYIYAYTHTQAFLLCLIKVWESTSKIIRRNGDIGKHKLNEMKAVNM